MYKFDTMLIYNLTPYISMFDSANGHNPPRNLLPQKLVYKHFKYTSYLPTAFCTNETLLL